MKYWKDSEVEHITYREGSRTSPYKHPAALTESDNVRIEIEIVPNTAEMREYLSPATFEYSTEFCVQVEARKWREGFRMRSSTFWIPLKVLGYDKEPANSLAFDEAMKIV